MESKIKEIEVVLNEGKQSIRCIYLSNGNSGLRVAGGKPYYSENLKTLTIPVDEQSMLEAFSKKALAKALKNKVD